MPGLRYGPDITDDAETMRRSLLDLQARLRRQRGRGVATRTTERSIERMKDAIAARFGDQSTMKRAARYSLRRQGYDESGATRKVGGVRLRARPAIPQELRAALRVNRPRVTTPRRGLRSNKEIVEIGKKVRKKAAAAKKKKRAAAQKARRTSKRAAQNRN